MPLKRCRVGPEFDKDKTQGVFAVDLDAVMQTAGLGSRAMHMFEANASQLLDGGAFCDEVAGEDDHTLAALFSATLTTSHSPASSPSLPSEPKLSHEPSHLAGPGGRTLQV